MKTPIRLTLLTLEEIRNLPEILENIKWDTTPEQALEALAPKTIRFEKELERTQKEYWKEAIGYYFYVDVWNCEPYLALMHIRPDGRVQSELVRGVTDEVPNELLHEAVYKAGGLLGWSKQYPVNEELGITKTVEHFIIRDGHYPVSDRLKEFLKAKLGTNEE